MTQGLALTNVLNVQVIIGAVPTAARNFGTAMIAGVSSVMSLTETLRSYSGLDGVGDDFPVTAPEYLAAQTFFSQAPQPALCYVGRWNNAVTGGESLAACMQRLAIASGDWYGTCVAGPAQDTDILAAAQVLDGQSSPRLFAVTTQEPGALTPAGTSDMAAVLKAANLKGVCTQYSSTNPYAAISLFGRFATVDYTGVNTTITGFAKNEPGVAADVITQTGAGALLSKNCNALAYFQDGSAQTLPGIMSSGEWIDQKIGLDWMQNSLQVAGFNKFKSQPKIAQTNDGLNELAAAYEVVMDQSVRNGLVTPGIWTGPNMGPLSTGQALPKGYLIWTPDIATQSPADRAARKAVPAQIACLLAGAIHYGAAIVNVQQ